MAGFDFYERRGNMFVDNMFFAGEAVNDGSISVVNLPDRFANSSVFRNLRLEDGIIRGYIYQPLGGNLITISGFRDLPPLDYVIIGNKGLFDMNPTAGWEFYHTVIGYVWMPNVQNHLGREAFDDALWKKRAYFPNLKHLGRRNFLSAYKSKTETLRIYAPNCIDMSDTFIAGATVPTPVPGRFDHTILYMDYAFWNGITTHDQLNAFLASSGTLVLIQDYTRPSIPSNVVISNVTATTFDITFNPSTFTNAFGWYEIFCETDDNPVSWYFHHKEILTTTATITGLTSGKNYQVKVRAADEYMNLSPFSNPKGIKTL